LPNRIADPEGYLIDVVIYISNLNPIEKHAFCEQEGINMRWGFILSSWCDLFNRRVPAEERRIPTRFPLIKVIFI
jgi:hypothetical protein